MVDTWHVIVDGRTIVGPYTSATVACDAASTLHRAGHEVAVSKVYSMARFALNQILED